MTRDEIKEALIHGVQGDGDFASEYQIDASTDSVVNVIVDLLSQVEREEERLLAIFASLGICPTDGESMPCMTCGAGL